MSRIFVVYGHHNLNKSFNQEIRDTFCSEAKKLGHEIDLINLHEEKPIPFYDGSEPSEQILDYRKRLEQSDVLFMISPCYNLRATAILENWIDLVLAPKWFFSFKRQFRYSEYSGLLTKLTKASKPPESLRPSYACFR